MNPSYGVKFDNYRQLGVKKLKERAKLIRSNKEFVERIILILDEGAKEKHELDSQIDVYAEESIYIKFPSEYDSKLMPEFHKADWKDKFSVLQKFKDERMQYFGKKILYEESPKSLPKNEYDLFHKEIAQRILSTNDENWNTIPRTYNEIDTLRNKFKDNKSKLELLDDINSYIEDMEKNYQNVS